MVPLAPDDAPQPSLFRDLMEGRASIAVRIAVALALAVFLTGAGLVLCYLLAALIPYWNSAYYYRTAGIRASNLGIYPRDELVAMVMIAAGAAWLAALIWLFFVPSWRRVIVRPMIYTVVVAAVTTFLGILAADSLRGEQELVIAGLCLIGGALVVLVWIQPVRRLTAQRPLRHHQDQLPDIRCPQCGYRMVGLHESRCPECGTTYTLDELIARQNFQMQDLKTTTAPPAPVPQPQHESSTASGTASNHNIDSFTPARA